VKLSYNNELSQKCYITLVTGLGGMSGAQAKAAVICGCVGIVAETSKEALMKRHKQGWVVEVIDDLEVLIRLTSFKTFYSCNL
jgi:urocanate hydratase